MKEPHYKHFSIEKYQSFYELREKGQVVVRVIFTPCPNGDYLLLHAFVKRQKRDTEKALEHSLRLLASLWDHPEYAVEYIVPIAKVATEGDEKRNGNSGRSE